MAPDEYTDNIPAAEEIPTQVEETPPPVAEDTPPPADSAPPVAEYLPPMTPVSPAMTSTPPAGYGNGPQYAFYPSAPAGFASPPPPAQEEPLPPYSPPDKEEDTSRPCIVTAVSPLTRADLEEMETQTRLPLWWSVTGGSGLLFFFSLAAVSLASERSGPDGIFNAIVCVLCCIAFLVALLWTRAVQRRELWRLTHYVTTTQEFAGVIEVYPDRVVRITPHSRTIVHLWEGTPTVWENPRLLTVSDGYAAIAWKAEDLTPMALEYLRRRLYPAIKPEHRKSRGRLMPAAERLADIPTIEVAEEILYQFRYLPDVRQERDRKTLLYSLRTLPFNVISATVGGCVLSALFRLPVPHSVGVVLFGLALFCLLQGITTAAIRIALKESEKPATPIGIVFTLEGLAVEEQDCLRFIPHGWYRYYTRQEALILELPVGPLTVPWQDIPDPEMVKRLLMLGD